VVVFLEAEGKEAEQIQKSLG
jgi:hypothetical protein